MFPECATIGFVMQHMLIDGLMADDFSPCTVKQTSYLFRAEIQIEKLVNDMPNLF